MTYQETAKILAMIKLAYPNSYNRLSDMELDQTVKLWQMQFKDYDANLVVAAVNTFISENLSEFAPNIAQIKDIAYKLQNGNQKTDDEIWMPVKKALSNGLYGSREEYAKLPEDIQKCVTPEQLKTWATLDNDELSFIRNEVIKEYRQKETRKRNMELLPTRAKEILMLKEGE